MARPPNRSLLLILSLAGCAAPAPGDENSEVDATGDSTEKSGDGDGDGDGDSTEESGDGDGDPTDEEPVYCEIDEFPPHPSVWVVPEYRGSDNEALGIGDLELGGGALFVVGKGGAAGHVGRHDVDGLRSWSTVVAGYQENVHQSVDWDGTHLYVAVAEGITRIDGDGQPDGWSSTLGEDRVIRWLDASGDRLAFAGTWYNEWIPEGGDYWDGFYGLRGKTNPDLGASLIVVGESEQTESGVSMTSLESGGYLAIVASTSIDKGLHLLGHEGSDIDIALTYNEGYAFIHRVIEQPGGLLLAGASPLGSGQGPWFEFVDLDGTPQWHQELSSCAASSEPRILDTAQGPDRLWVAITANTGPDSFDSMIVEVDFEGLILDVFRFEGPGAINRIREIEYDDGVLIVAGDAFPWVGGPSTSWLARLE